MIPLISPGKLALCFSSLLLSALGMAVRGGEFVPEPALSLNISGVPRRLEVGDLDGDGKADMVIAIRGNPASAEAGRDGGTDGVLIFLQKDGDFPLAANRVIAVQRPGGLTVGRFGEDAERALAVADEAQRLHLYAWDEGLAVDHCSFNCNQYSDSLAVGRIGKGGMADFLTGPVWRKWLGGDQFQCGYFSGPTANDNDSSLLADLNHDGMMDAVFATKNNAVRIYYGPFLTMTVHPVDASEFIQLAAPVVVGRVAAADLNGDGRPDLVAGGKDGGELLIYYQNAPIGFTDKSGPSRSVKGFSKRDPVVFAVADVDCDGLSDVVAAGRGGGQVHLFYQRKGKEFASDVDKADQTLSVAGSVQCLAVGDIDGDGAVEIIVGCLDEGKPGAVKVYKHNMKK